jgi:signal transduction histidine kinase
VASAIILVNASGSAAAWAAAGSLAGAVVVYLAAGRRALVARKASALTRWAAALLIVAVVLAAWFDPIAQIVQAVLFPLLWRVSSGVRSAIGRSAVLAVAIGLTTGLGKGDWAMAALSTPLVLIFTIAIGLWIADIQKYGLERDRLLAELRAAQDEVAALERQAGITEERARVAREIHDTIAQSLTGLVMTAQRASTVVARSPESLGPTLALMEDLATEALSEARALVASYTPVSVSGGLTATLSALAERFSTETGVAVTVSGEAPDVDREAEVVLLRCAQEALANVRKHAHAGKVSIDLHARDEGAELTVTDDGVGIGERASGGYGLAGMAERVRLAGGSLRVSPVEGGGTAVQVVLPRRSADEVSRSADEVVT